MRSFRIPSFRSTVFFFTKIQHKKLPSNSATPQTPSLRHFYLKSFASLAFSCLFDGSSLFGYSDRKNYILFNYSCIKLQQAAYLREWIRKENKQVGFIYEKEYMVSPIYFFVWKYYPVSLIYILPFFSSWLYKSHKIHLKSTWLHQKQKKKKKKRDGNSK